MPCVRYHLDEGRPDNVAVPRWCTVGHPVLLYTVVSLGLGETDEVHGQTTHYDGSGFIDPSWSPNAMHACHMQTQSYGGLWTVTIATTTLDFIIACRQWRYHYNHCRSFEAPGQREIEFCVIRQAVQQNAHLCYASTFGHKREPQGRARRRKA